MRIWSIHPKYLDAKGLVALWRETLLARHVLEGKTKGYTNHPQLNRFRKAKNPVATLNQYLVTVFEEAERRGYRFGREKILPGTSGEKLTVTTGQMIYESEHLRRKLKQRDEKRFMAFSRIERVEPHPLFDVIDGPVEAWERTGDIPSAQKSGETPKTSIH